MKKILAIVALLLVIPVTASASCVNGTNYVLKGYFEDANNNPGTGQTLSNVLFDVFYDDGTSSIGNAATAEMGQGWYRYTYTSNGKNGTFIARDSTSTYKNFPGGFIENLCDSQNPAATVAAIWGETLPGSYGAGTAGYYLDAQVSAAGGGTDPWATLLPGAYGAGTAGKILGDNLNATITSRQPAGPVDLNANQGTVTMGTVTTVTNTVNANLTQIGGVAQSATDLKDFADAGYDPLTNKVQGVVLVDTTTANADMRGTDNAATAAALATAQADLDNPAQYKADVTNLDAPVSSRAAAADYTAARAAKLDNLDVATSTRSAPGTPQAIDMAQTLPVTPTAGTTGQALKDADTFLDAAVTSRQPVGPVNLNADQSAVIIGRVDVVTGHTPQTGDNYARLGVPAGVSIAADIAAAQADLDNPAQYKADVTNLDAPVSSRAAAVDYTAARAAKLDNIDATVSSRATVGGVWGEALPGAYGVGTAGYHLDAPVSTAGGGGAADWTTAEKNQLRYRLGVDGTTAAPVTNTPNLTVDLNANQGGATIGTVNTLTGHTPQTGDSFARIGVPAGVSMSADIAAVQADLNNPAQYKADVTNLDAPVSSRAAAVDYTAARAAKLDNLDATVSSRSSHTAGDVLTQVVVDGYTVQQIQCLLASVLMGKSSGGGTTTITYRNLTDTTNRVSGTFDANRNRTNVTLTLTGCP